jgi:acetoin utilization protein AcuB
MPGRTVADYMSRDVSALRETDTLRAAVELELKHHIRHVPVLDDAGTLVGILTDRDIKRALPTPLSHPSPEEYATILDETPVGRVMTREPYIVAPSTPVVDAVSKMIAQKIGGFPVLADGVLVGMFTQSDALRGYVELLKGPAATP